MQSRAANVVAAMSKLAEDSEPHWGQRQRAALRAVRRSDTGVGKVMVTEEHAIERAKAALLPMGIGLGAGALLGAGLGHLSGGAVGGKAFGALVGAPIGMLVGQAIGQAPVDKKRLAEHGIETRMGGFDYKLSPEAKKKYHDNFQKKGSMTRPTAVTAVMQKMAYSGYSDQIRTEKPVYELDDATLKRRADYEKGETGLRTGMGALGGGILGAAHGGVIGGGKGAVVGGLLGGGMGAGLGLLGSKLRELESSRESHRREKSSSRKHGSAIFEQVRVFDKIASGRFGPEARLALEGTCEAIPSHLRKVAVAEESVTSESDTDARKRRLAELLKKREATGTSTGSASPNPPKGD